MKNKMTVLGFLIFSAASSVLFAQSQAIDPANFPKAAKVFDKAPAKDTKVEKLTQQILALQAQLEKIQNTKHECVMACCTEKQIDTARAGSK